MRKIIHGILVCFLSVMCLAGCSVSRKNCVAYTVYPIRYILQYIAGDTIRFESIQSNDIVFSSHLLEDSREILNDSGVLIHIGDLEPYVNLYRSEFLETGVRDLDLSVMNTVYDFRRYTKNLSGNEPEYSESDWYESDVFDSVDMMTQDLCVWMDPNAMASCAKEITECLSEYYPENKDMYEKNYKSLRDELISLDASYQVLGTSLRKEGKTIRFATVSASFGNWQKAYGFEIYPIVLSRYGVLPNEAQLQVIKDRLIADHVQYIAYEPNMTDEMRALCDSLIDELGLIPVTLSNISSLTEEEQSEGKDYLSLMYENLGVLSRMETVNEE